MPRKMYDYEISFRWVGKGRKPAYVDSEYGFGMNPPVSVRATNKKNALGKLKLPKTVKVARVQRYPIR